MSDVYVLAPLLLRLAVIANALAFWGHSLFDFSASRAFRASAVIISLLTGALYVPIFIDGLPEVLRFWPLLYCLLGVVAAIYWAMRIRTMCPQCRHGKRSTE